jgi:hypothetical protein
MHPRRVLFSIDRPELRLVITESSKAALEPLNLEFETVEDAWEHVTMHPLEFPSDLYAALLERLRELGGGGL